MKSINLHAVLENQEVKRFQLVQEKFVGHPMQQRAAGQTRNSKHLIIKLDFGCHYFILFHTGNKKGLAISRKSFIHHHILVGSTSFELVTPAV